MISILTGENDAEIVKTLNPREIADKWKDLLNIDVGDRFRNLETIEYLKCNKTGFCWYSPLDASGDAELYEQLEKYDWYYMQNKWEFPVAISLFSPGSSVLEIGVGEGNFLCLARQEGFRAEGVELNPNGARRAREHGFKIHEELLGNLSVQTDDRFDVICSFQVLEHVPNPKIFIEEMISMLRPGGKLILSVPNSAVMRKIDPYNNEILNQPPHHMGHWDEASFRALENILPLKIRSVYYEPLADYHIEWMVNSYLRNVLAPIGKSFSRILINRVSTLPIQWLLKAGLKKNFRGHTMLVELDHQIK